jgi:hypothetical protein
MYNVRSITRLLSRIDLEYGGDSCSQQSSSSQNIFEVDRLRGNRNHGHSQNHSSSVVCSGTRLTHIKQSGLNQEQTMMQWCKDSFNLPRGKITVQGSYSCHSSHSCHSDNDRQITSYLHMGIVDRSMDVVLACDWGSSEHSQADNALNLNLNQQTSPAAFQLLSRSGIRAIPLFHPTFCRSILLK